MPPCLERIFEILNGFLALQGIVTKSPVFKITGMRATSCLNWRIPTWSREQSDADSIVVCYGAKRNSNFTFKNLREYVYNVLR